MSKKLILFLMVLLFGSANFMRAEVVEIGDGTSTTYMVPFNSLYGYSFTEQVFLASEIGTAGTINSISFHIGQAYTSAQTNQYTVWMKNVARETFASNTDYEPVTAADKVFEGTWEIPVCATGDWITLTLDTPFAYDGTSNLMFAMLETTQGYSTRYFYCTSVTNSGISYYSDSYVPDPYNLDSYSGSKVVRSNRNNIQLNITAGGGGGGISVPFEVQIGEGTSTTGYFPFYTLYNYSIAENLYLASELTAAGMEACTINSLSWYATNTTGYEQQGISIWMANVSDEALTTTSHVTTGMTKVFTGTSTPLVGWNEFAFNESDFEWDGTSNILIFCQRNNGAWNSTINWQATTGLPFNAMAYKYQDSGAYDVTVANTVSTSTTRPNIIIKGVTNGGPVEPWNPDYNAPLGEIEIVAPENGEQNVNPTILRWNNAENAHLYSVEFGTVYGNYETIVESELVEGWEGTLNLAEAGITLDNNTRYYWRVTNTNNVGDVHELAMFVTTMNTATNVKVVPNKIFVDGSTVVKWSIVGGAVGELPETTIGSGTSTSSYLPTYNLYNYSLTQQIYTVDEIGNAGLISSITFLPQGSITRNLQVYMVNTDKTSFSGSNDWITVTADDLVFEGSVAMAAPQTTITLNDPFMYDGTNLAIIVNDLTGTWTSSVAYATFTATAQAINIYQDGGAYNPLAPTGYSGTVRDFKNQIIINKDREAMPMNRDLIGCNVYVDSVLMNVNGPITARQYDLTPAHMAELGLTVYNPVEGHNVNVTGVYDYGESNFSANTDNSILYISGYGTANGWVKDLMSEAPLAGVTVKYNGTDEFGNSVSYTATTAANGNYTINNIKAGTYTVKATLDPYAEAKEEDVVVEYNGTTTVNLYLHEVYAPVYKVYAEEGSVMGNPVADVIWSFSNFTINNGGGGQGGNGDTFSVDFEAGLPAGWTTIDNGTPTGYGWTLASSAMGTGYGHNGSLDCMISKSYDNNYGIVYPDNYLVTPQVNIAAGSTFSFYACAQDASYAAEHYGVAISDNATGPWTMVEEWTMTAKEGPKGARGTNAQGNWYQKTVDLSSYAGQKYIAIRHFNCSDQFYLDVDDVELSNGSKRAYADAETCGKTYTAAPTREMWDVLGEVNCTSGYQYGVATDGNFIYTSSWSASSTSQFYKYDMDGNFVEEFNVAGSGQIRDLTYDGTYFYGVANASTIYCLDLANHTLVGTIPSAYGAMRCCGYDSERDGFWVVGNWSGNLCLVDRTGAVQITGPAPTSASGVAYFKDGDGVEHVYCFNNGDNGVYDYNIATNTISSTAVFNYNSTPGYASGSSGGCHIANYGDKLAFYGDLQQSPNYVAICELGAAQGGGGGGGSQFATTDHFFRVYRQPVLIANMPEVIEPELLVDNYGLNFADTMYTDNTWATLESGIYQYGVSAVYPWADRNDNNVTEIVWSNEVSHNMDATVIVEALVASGYYQGTVVTLTNNNENVEYSITFDETTIDTIYDFRKGEYTVTATLPGYTSNFNETEVSIWEDMTIAAVLTEILAPTSGLEVSATGYARWNDVIPASDIAMSYYVTLDGAFIDEDPFNFYQFDEETLTVGQTYTAGVAVYYTTGLSEYITADFTYLGCGSVANQVTNLQADNEAGDLNVILTWDSTQPTPPTPPSQGSEFTEGFEGGMPTDWTVIDGNNDGWTWCLTSAIPTTWTYYASLTLDWYRSGTNAICSGSYINGVGALTPNEYLVTPQLTLVNGSTFSFWAAATDASYPADHFGVFVSDNGTSDWTMVNEWTLTAKKDAVNGGRESRDGEGAKLGTWYQYTVDLSAYAGEKYLSIRHFNCNDQYIMCVDDLELSIASKGNRDELVYNFDDSSLEGWTTIDGGSPAGYGWNLASNKLGTGYGHNGSTDCVLSQSYDNNYGVVYPDNYLISPEKARYSQISFFACAQDASYAAEHYGVAVSTTGANAADFTIVEEWTLTAKAGAKGARGTNTQGNWYEKTVDLSAYAGQDIWVAIRHFNCSDMFYILVDDITLTTGGGGGGSTTNLTPGMYNILVDGIVVGATSETTYTYEAPDFEEYNYTVVYVDANYGISCIIEGENSIDYAAENLGVDENEVVNAIYPNPTNGDLHINATAMRHISVYNAMGQLVYSQDMNADEMVLNMAQFEDGVYMLNIITENGSSVKRVTVAK